MFIFQVKKIENNQEVVSLDIDIRDKAGLFHVELYCEHNFLFEDGLCLRDAEPTAEKSFTIFKNDLLPNGVDDICYSNDKNSPGHQLDQQLEKFISIIYHKVIFKASLSKKYKAAFFVDVDNWELLSADSQKSEVEKNVNL